ncbi:hypothetical protein [Candidatus Spongiihabitans sp.]|uniref:hypothetical protein n=1 Tax=Candidatus Spongiihabitans sp. TaxID=3101308 RepID=UPI003C6F974D
MNLAAMNLAAMNLAAMNLAAMNLTAMNLTAKDLTAMTGLLGTAAPEICCEVCCICDFSGTHTPVCK